MKKLIFQILTVAFILLLPSVGFAQTIPVDSLNMGETVKPNDDTELTFEEKVDRILLFIAEHTRSEDHFKLYPTTNIWTFLKLDTRTGELWQVQFDISEDNRFQTSLNTRDLTYGSSTKAGRFELYPTQNSYNFLLLDKHTGRVWQAQWSTKASNRFIIPIY